MKRMDLFCSSSSSTAICSSFDHRSMVRHGTTRPLHPHKSKPYLSSSKPADFRSKSYKNSANCRDKPSDELRRKSCADIRDVHGSSRYLLSDKVPCIDWISESDALIIDPAYQHSKPRLSQKSTSSSSGYCSSNLILEHHRHDSPALKSSSSSARSRDQVVVLWVSIHCKGCEGKLRKHISKMEGVTSFSIDLATKKVTVVGNVTPLGVLSSVSKVKKAQLWPSPSPSPPCSASA